MVKKHYFVIKNTNLFKHLKTKKIIIIFLWVLFIILLRWNSFTAYYDRDEGVYAYVAREIKSGYLPYETVFDHKPPLIYLVYLLAQSVNKNALWLPRLIAFIATVATIVVSAYIAEKEFDQNSGLYLVWIIAPMFSLPLLTPFSANTEIFMLLPTTLALLTYLSYNKRRGDMHFFLFGSLASVSIFFKPLAIFVFLYILLIWLFETYKKTGLQSALRGGFYILSGGLIVSLLILLPFFIKNLEKDLYEMVVKYNQHFALGPWFKRRFVKFTYKFIINWPVLFILPLWFIYKRPKRWWFYSGLVATSLLSIFKTDLGHYYLLIIPFWAIIITYSINILSKELRNKLNLSFEKTRLLISLVVFISLLIPIRKQFFIPPDKFTTYVHGVHNPFEEAKVLSEKLKDMSLPSDTVYIAGHEPEILIYSDRKSASKYIYAYPLVFATPLQMKFHEELFNEFKSLYPDYLVLSSEYLITDGSSTAKQPSKYWNELINLKYKLLGGVIREKNEVYWNDASEKTKITQYRLLLYKNIDNN